MIRYDSDYASWPLGVKINLSAFCRLHMLSEPCRAAGIKVLSAQSESSERRGEEIFDVFCIWLVEQEVITSEG